MGWWATLLDAFNNFLEPWLVLLYCLSHIPQTVAQLVRSGQSASLLSPSAFHDALFANFWATFGPMVKQGAEDSVLPLLQGYVRGGRIRDLPHAPIHGTVVEVGAGTGLWADVFARFVDGDAPAEQRITKIYGIEPNATCAAALRTRVKQLGLGSVYEVVPVGVERIHDEAAWGGYIEPGSVDAIVTILCLCSIPEPEKNIALLCRLLKPGGTWYAYEHVRNIRGGPLVSLYQRLITPVWKVALGSCSLCRDTGNAIRDAGPWEEVDLCQPPDEASYTLFPHTFGTATKALK